MKGKNILIILALLLLFNIALAEMNPSDLTWGSMAGIVFDKDSYLANEPITGKVSFLNTENYPAVGVQLVLQLASGTYEYPSHLNSNDTILGEQVIDFGYVLPNSKKELTFSFSNPGMGEYRIDSYAWVTKSKAIGASNIFYNPSISETISVEGVAKERALIDRLNTEFGGEKGQSGFLVQPGQSFSGKVLIKNGGIKKENLKLGITICEWALPFCKLTEKIIDVGQVEANSTKTIDVSLFAPTIPSAYEINLVLYDNNKIESLFKNRVIVSGGTAKIRKAFISGLDADNYLISLIISGSPDHFALPDFDNFDVSVELYDGENLVEEKKEMVTKILAGEIIQKEFNLASKEFNLMCLKVSKGGVVYDKECYAADIQSISADYVIANPKSVLVDWTYNETTLMLSIKLTKEQINAQVRLFNSDETLFKEMIATSSVYIKEILVQKQNLFLMVNDFDAKTQQLIPLNFGVNPDDRNSVIFGQNNDVNSGILNQTTCSGRICSLGTICNTQTELTIDGDCCYSECISAGSITENYILNVPLILWIALIVLIIAIVIVYEITKKVKRK